jgi:hypothetical protein
VTVVPEAAHGFAGRLDELGNRVSEAIPEDLKALAADGPEV